MLSNHKTAGQRRHDGQSFSIQVVVGQGFARPEAGAWRIEIPSMTLDVSIDPETARRRANGYLVTYVSMMLHALNPILILNGPPVWRLSLSLWLRDIGDVATLGTLDVDAHTGGVVSLTTAQIRVIQDQANAIVARFAPATAGSS